MAAAILIAGYRPEKVFDYFLENMTAFTFIAVLALTYKRLALSETSYLLLLVFLAFHEWGAHYKYSDVPLGEWMKTLTGSQRNSYDRVMHFSYGFLWGYPFQELFMRTTGVVNRWRYITPIALTLALSASYEMLEALMASILSPERGEEFVGMQGDMWDSQEDMFMAGVGAVAIMLLVALVRHRRWARAEERELAGVARRK